MSNKQHRNCAHRQRVNPRTHRRFPLRSGADLASLPPLPPRFSCDKGKIGYPDRESAELILATMDQSNPRRREVRTYRCPTCSHWHLTSKVRLEAPPAGAL